MYLIGNINSLKDKPLIMLLSVDFSYISYSDIQTSSQMPSEFLLTFTLFYCNSFSSFFLSFPYQKAFLMYVRKSILHSATYGIQTYITTTDGAKFPKCFISSTMFAEFRGGKTTVQWCLKSTGAF